MKIVIELDDTFYDILCLGGKSKKAKLTDGAVDILFKAVLNGTPLPKGHGDLIDRSEISIPYDICDGDEAMGYVNEVSAIVEADKENEDEEE